MTNFLRPLNYLKKLLQAAGSFFLFLWNFPIIQFLKIVAAYGFLINFVAYTFIQFPLNWQFSSAFGLVYYIVFFEIPLLFRPQQVRYLRAVSQEVLSTTKERGRKTVEDSTGREAKR